MGKIFNNCGACGTPKKKDRFGELSCPHCYPELFVGRSKEKTFIPLPSVEEEIAIPKENTEDERNVLANFLG